MEDALLNEKLAYHIYSGVPFFGRAEIKDALSYLRMIVSRDDLSFRRVVNLPKRNMGRRRMAFLEEYAGKNGCTYPAQRGATLTAPRVIPPGLRWISIPCCWNLPGSRATH